MKGLAVSSPFMFRLHEEFLLITALKQIIVLCDKTLYSIISTSKNTYFGNAEKDEKIDVCVKGKVQTAMRFGAQRKSLEC